MTFLAGVSVVLLAALVGNGIHRPKCEELVYGESACCTGYLNPLPARMKEDAHKCIS